MLSFLPSFILGPLCFLLFVLNTAFWGSLIYLIIPAKVLVPVRPWRRGCTTLMTRIAETWVSFNMLGLNLTQRIQWDVQGTEKLDRRGSYLVSCNHRSWIDIVVLQRVFNRRIPFPKFFIKRSLAWIPVLGQAWWALDFPFMRRYSKDYLERHPEKRGKDLEATRRACEKFENTPVTVLNFLEGTRFTPEKHDRQGSPYAHLLRPKAGGVALVLESMGDRLRTMLDVTVVYPDREVKFWDLFTNRLGRVVIRIRERDIPREVLAQGTYEEDPAVRERFQAWVGQIWAEKDRLIDRLLQQVPGRKGRQASETV
jgi:1-acyl-sn-glycerol-3-phosphate acyltransferase